MRKCRGLITCGFGRDCYCRFRVPSLQFGCLGGRYNPGKVRQQERKNYQGDDHRLGVFTKKFKSN